MSIYTGERQIFFVFILFEKSRAFSAGLEALRNPSCDMGLWLDYPAPLVGRKDNALAVYHCNDG